MRKGYGILTSVTLVLVSASGTCNSIHIGRNTKAQIETVDLMRENHKLLSDRIRVLEQAIRRIEGRESEDAI